MAAEVRRIRADEVPDFIRSVAVPFLEPGRDGSVEHWTPHIEPDRAWVADDGGRLVGNACVFSRDVTVPARPGRPCPVLPMAAISGVGVYPSHRRQGILRRLMASMLEDARDRGEMIAALLASESVIYGRFGFGLATTAQRTRINTRESRFDVPAGRPTSVCSSPTRRARSCLTCTTGAAVGVLASRAATTLCGPIPSPTPLRIAVA